MTDSLPGIDADSGPTSGTFADLPNLRILVDYVPRGTIETRDYEQWDPEGPFTNWWWLTLQRDDGVWVEDSCQIELAADSVEALQLKTAATIKALLAATHAHYSFTAMPGPFEEPEPPDAEDGATSVAFAEIDNLCGAAIRQVMAMD